MDVAALEWLAGAWQGEHDGGVLEEHWMRPAGGSMLGSSRVVANGKTVHAEFLLLQEDGEGGIRLLLVMPERRQVELRAVSLGERKITYQDAARDPRERLTYAIEADGGLLVTLEKTRDGTPVTTYFHMRRPESTRRA